MQEEILKLPNNFLQKLRKLYPERFEAIAATFLRKKIPSFRINYAQTDLVTLRDLLTRNRVRFEELDFPKGAFLLKSDLRHLQTTEIYLKGLIYVQNVSSMLPALVLAPQPGEVILDLCAAPGAKTTQLLSLCRSIELHAVEKARVRYYKLLTTIKNQGFGNDVRIHLIDGIWVRKKFPEQFDKILVDAPCSTEGRFFVENNQTFKYWKDKKVKEMTHTQKKLFHAAFFALKEGGELVYSTCTFSPEENEGIVDWFFDKFHGKLEMVPIDLSALKADPGFKRWDDTRYAPEVELARRILPNEYLEAFFIAKFKKLSF